MRVLALLIGLVGCAEPGEPAWAVDLPWVEPSGDAEVHVLHTWNLYDAHWEDGRSPRRFVCAVVVEAWATMDDRCEACERGWSVTERSVRETDCASSVDVERFDVVEGLGLGPPVPELGADPRGGSMAGWVDHGDGFALHGWAYPARLDDAPDEVVTTGWDGERAFAFDPIAAWHLEAP